MPSYSIVARRHHPQASASYKECYCFDDETRGIVAEALLEAATRIIALATKATFGQVIDVINIEFTDDTAEAETWEANPGDIIMRLDFLRPEADGSLYEVDIQAPREARAEQGYGGIYGYAEDEAWLCPVLLDYFEAPPQVLYARITKHSPTTSDQ